MKLNFFKKFSSKIFANEANKKKVFSFSKNPINIEILDRERKLQQLQKKIKELTNQLENFNINKKKNQIKIGQKSVSKLEESKQQKIQNSLYIDLLDKQQEIENIFREKSRDEIEKRKNSVNPEIKYRKEHVIRASHIRDVESFRYNYTLGLSNPLNYFEQKSNEQVIPRAVRESENELLDLENNLYKEIEPIVKEQIETELKSFDIETSMIPHELANEPLLNTPTANVGLPEFLLLESDLNVEFSENLQNERLIRLIKTRDDFGSVMKEEGDTIDKEEKEDEEDDEADVKLITLNTPEKFLKRDQYIAKI